MAGVNHLVGGKYTAVTHRKPGKVRANQLSQQLHPPRHFLFFLAFSEIRTTTTVGGYPIPFPVSHTSQLTGGLIVL
jgi:hypothetical protein